MSTNIPRTFPTLVLVASTLAMLDGCSNADDDAPSAPPNPSLQAQAVQYSILSAKAAHDQRPPGTRQDDGAKAPDAPPSTGAPGGDSPTTNTGAPTGGALPGGAQLLGQPPLASAPSVAANLPPALGAPHLYHLGRDNFFLDQANAIGLTPEQRKRLTALKERAAIAYATKQRQIDRGEQDLWGLTSSAAPDLAKIETKIGETARLTAQQRMDFIRAVGVAVGVLSDAQRKAVASQEAPRRAGTMPPAPDPSGISTGGDPPSPPGSEMSGMADAGSPGGMEQK